MWVVQYFLPEHIENFLFVKVWSGRTNAIFTSNLISNQTIHKLKNVHTGDNYILLVFKINKS